MEVYNRFNRKSIATSCKFTNVTPHNSKPLLDSIEREAFMTSIQEPPEDSLSNLFIYRMNQLQLDHRIFRILHFEL